MNTYIDGATYERWKKNIADLLPAKMECEDCNGTGEGTCPHCGHETDDGCETCHGTGKVNSSELLTPQLFMRVQKFEKAMLEHWANGDPISTDKNRPINPLIFLLGISEPIWSGTFDNSPKILLSLPLTSDTEKV